jgi:rRNA maturation RNase YbeY
MNSITIRKQSSYPISAQSIKKAISKTLKKNGITSDVEVSVFLVNEAKMGSYAQKYLRETAKVARAHPVLSFPDQEIKGSFAFPPDKLLHLGEIIISYPQAIKQANKTNKLINDVVCDLAQHGALHLLGIHHD